MKRICINTTDVMFITGKSERQSRNIINDIKDHFGKAKHQVVTIKEFCEYLGFKEEEIKSYIK
jgi:ribosomal silencing factor RsfS